MKKKYLPVVLIFLMIAAIAGGCSSREEEAAEEESEIILDIYAQYMDADTKVPYDYAVEKLKDAYPQVKLNLIAQAQDDGETLETLAATGQLPDIFQANTNIINTFRETNQVMVLDEVAESSGYLDMLYDSSKDMVYSEDGHIYCFSYVGNEYVIWYYNKELFDQYHVKVPTTFDELLACIAVFRENDIVPMALFGQEGWITTAMYDVIATRYVPGGVKSLDLQDTKITDEGYREAAAVLEKLANAGMFQEHVNLTTYDQASEMFLNGEAAMFLNGQWYIEDAANEFGDRVDWMFYPAQDEEAYEQGKTVFAGGGSVSGYAVNPDGEYPELAAEVAEFLAEKYCEAKVMMRNNPMVALDTGVTPLGSYPPMMYKLSETIPEMTSTTKFSWGLTNPWFYESIMANTQGLVSKEYTAEEFTEGVRDDLNREQ